MCNVDFGQLTQNLMYGLIENPSIFVFYIAFYMHLTCSVAQVQQTFKGALYIDTKSHSNPCFGLVGRAGLQPKQYSLPQETNSVSILHHGIEMQ